LIFPNENSCFLNIGSRAGAASDSDAQRALHLRPFILTSRVDFFDETAFAESGVWQLYEELFPESERDDPRDIVNWVMEADVGEERQIVFEGGEKISNKLDSRFFILILAGRAIGLGFVTYDHASNLIYGNYIAVHPRWRRGNIARAFFDQIMEILGKLFPNYEGMVFEVETFDKDRLERIIGDLERTGSRLIAVEDDRDEIRKFLRVTWYYQLNCFFFSDESTKEPLSFRSPCLDPRMSKSEAKEEDYWIMLYRRQGAPPDLSQARPLWNKAVEAIYIEILAKSLIMAYPDCATAYWAYVKALVEETLAETSSTAITFSKYLDRRDDPLLARWMKLRIDLAV
jgi:GNAT superfamily N-acetyltransferase